MRGNVIVVSVIAAFWALLLAIFAVIIWTAADD